MKIDHGERSLSATFMALLIEDVIAARGRLNGSQNESARRDVVRASVAAMEGSTWVARKHVRGALSDVGRLSPLAELAFRELSYSVSDTGQIRERVQALSLLTVVRLIVAQAKIICPEMEVDFSTSGWSDLRETVAIRNRITHPKIGQPLGISDKDLAIVGSALAWLVATVEIVMSSTNSAMAQHNRDLRDTLDRLRAGDADALAEYRVALGASDEDE
jgi:hypothetical protein